MGKLEIQEKLDSNLATQILTGDLESGIYFYLISDKIEMMQKGMIIIQ